MFPTFEHDLGTLQMVLLVPAADSIREYNDLAICDSKETTVVLRGSRVDDAACALAFEQGPVLAFRSKDDRVRGHDEQVLR